MNQRHIDLDHTTMEWGIKESFRRYFERLPDHRYDLGEGARRCSDGQIEFRAAAPVDSDDTLAFRGVLQLSAHHGALSVRIANPWITFRGGNAAELSAEVDSVDGEPVRMRIAELTADEAPSGAESTGAQPTGAQPTGAQRSLEFRAEVAEEGQFLFMGNYFAGDPMDPVTVWLTTP